VTFVEFEKRTWCIYLNLNLDKVEGCIERYTWCRKLVLTRKAAGLPPIPPINIEVASEDFDALIKTAVGLKNYLDFNTVPGSGRIKNGCGYNQP
jgi:hypothetical protein